MRGPMISSDAAFHDLKKEARHKAGLTLLGRLQLEHQYFATTAGDTTADT